MIRRTFRFSSAIAAFVLMALAYFTATAFAITATAGDAVAAAATTDESSILDLARPVYEAFANHQFALMGSLLVILVVALVKRYLGDKIAWLHSDAGGSALALVGAAATALAAGLVTPGSHLSFDLFKSALLVGVTAAGTYAVLKNLVIDPILKPLARKAPSWLQPVFNLIFAIFDHAGADDGAAAVAEAEQAGADAVAVDPGQGAAGVVGKPGELS